MQRREFSQKLLTTVTGYSLLSSFFSVQGFSKSVKPLVDHWAIQLNEYCNDLRQESINPKEWQHLTESLFSQISMEDLLKFIDFERLTTGFTYPDLGVNTKRVEFPKLTGLPENTAFVKKIFGMKKDRAIIPHGHSNMASAHLILKGEMHLRHYEKVDEYDSNLIIKPTIDKMVNVGQYSSISDQKDNVHWFIANTETAFTFDVIMLDLNQASYDIHNIDIYEKEDLSDGTMRVPILDVEAALKKYGKSHH